jgi:hypothetical protein
MTPERDGFSGIAPISVIDPALLAADNTPGLIDLLDYGSATLLIQVGIGGITFTGTNKIELVLTHGSAADGSDQVAVTDNDVIKDALAPASISNGIIRSLIVAHAAADIQKLGYIGGKRYIKLLADFSGTHGTGTGIAATCVRGRQALKGTA